MLGAVFVSLHAAAIVLINYYFFFAVNEAAKIRFDEFDGFLVIKPPNYPAEIFFKILECGLVMWDDLGKSPWMGFKFRRVRLSYNAIKNSLRGLVPVKIVKFVDVLDGLVSEEEISACHNKLFYTQFSSLAYLHFAPDHRPRP